LNNLPNIDSYIIKFIINGVKIWKLFLMECL
jgi:hypothetical protein